MNEKSTLAIVQATISLGFCGFGLFHLLWILMDDNTETTKVFALSNIIGILDYLLVVILGMMVLYDAISTLNSAQSLYDQPDQTAQKPKLSRTILSFACIVLGLFTVLRF
ncbi:hypothetical protein N6H18_08855 [Reichenbachiella agarivorans]|uniref:Uncharacterized protein n=1 Tax=Reichenbachiella agarivorans TaxID=2979464 RepID=A0ABY6CU61_9BACT|nr:hypothetical protein [Reichenbachiella agarivorans]UXP34051.1 hypothetical protein N6H18_08855 [Reichenbachiella agarivorans]